MFRYPWISCPYPATGHGTESSGVVRIIKDLDEPLEGKDVLIVEDIIDSGRTLSLSDRGTEAERAKEHPSVYPS